MSFPLGPEYIQRVRPIIAEKKNQTFDNELCHIIKRRAIVHYSIRTPEEYERVTTVLSKIVRAEVNDAILTVIFSDNPLLFHDTSVPKQRQILYKIEDNIRKTIRNLIEEAYEEAYNGEDQIDRDVVRKKVTGCLNAIAVIINNKNFFKTLEEQSKIKSTR